MVVDLVHGALCVAEAGRGGPASTPATGPCVGFNSSITNWSILPATGSTDPAFPADARGQVVRLRTH